MTDEVRAIFKILLKVPVLIFGAFLIFNIFAFGYTYSKALGLSYVAMQEVVENNYITGSQANQFRRYFYEIEKTPLIHNMTLITGKVGDRISLWDKNSNNLGDTYTGYRSRIVDTAILDRYSDVSPADHAGIKVQYGHDKTVGIHCEFSILWPLSYQYTNPTLDPNAGQVKQVAGAGKVATPTENIINIKGMSSADDPYDNGDINSREQDKHMNNVKIPIDIYYTVPGLKYYSDLADGI